MDAEKSLVFDCQSNEESFEEWLDQNTPSQISRTRDGIDWIWVQRSTDSLDTERDVIELKKSWECLKESGQPINVRSITQLAKTHNVLSGKWFLAAATGGKADHIWRLVARGVMEGKLGHCAKVQPVGKYNPDPAHVICIYNKDFTNKEEIFYLENAIRDSCRIRCRLIYKPEVYTYVGLNKDNKWYVRPSFYESEYDTRTRMSKVKETGLAD